MKSDIKYPIVYLCKYFDGDTLIDETCGVNEIYSTIEEAIEAIDKEIEDYRLCGSKRTEHGIIHHLLDSKLSSEAENRTEVSYTYKAGYGYGGYSIFTIKLSSMHSCHIHF